MSDPNRSYTVLFLCTGNSARSILAEALMSRAGNGRFRSYSAGSQPKGEIHPGALRWLRKEGFSTEPFRSKSWNEYAGPDAPAFDFIVTVCDNAAGETCPVWLGKPLRTHWGVPDPAAVQGSDAEIDAAFAETARTLGERIRLFADLPIDVLDEMALKHSLDDIGQKTAPSA
jgi:arsenate reductase